MITITKAEADAYFLSILHSEVWEDADTEDQIKAIALSSNMIDQRYIFLEDYSVTGAIVPQTIKNAIAELAKFVLTKDPTGTPNEKKYTHMRFDDMEVDVNPLYARSVSIIPDYINEMLLPYTKRKTSGSAYKPSGGRRLTRC